MPAIGSLYSRNKYFDVECWTGAATLEFFETTVHIDDAINLSVNENYEVTIEDSWAEFIKENCY